jgi:hypothetical protein
MDKNNQYAIMDNSGMVIEKSLGFNKDLCGYATNVINKSRDILKTKDTMNSIEIFFENSIFLLKDDCSTNLTIAMIDENKK